MKIDLIKLCQWRIPRQFAVDWMRALEREFSSLIDDFFNDLKPKISNLTNTRVHSPPVRSEGNIDPELFIREIHLRYRPSKKKRLSLKNHRITLAFLEKTTMKQLNRDFRSKDRVTDILSFSSTDKKDLGELALCGPLIQEQALSHGLKVREELGWLLTHGFLHLLGFEHEKGDKKAKIMFKLQEKLFERLSKLKNRDS